MKILVDLHHRSLWNSLKMTLEGRLGHTLYRPYGMEWFTQGYWMIAKPYNDHPSTIKQYLESPTDDRTMTWQEFMDTDVDVVIASYIDHVRPYYKLIHNYKPKAKLVHQMGNEWPVDFNIVKNLMASTELIPYPTNTNVVFYHQEFDTSIYRYVEPQQSNLICSFVNILPTASIFVRDWQDFQELEAVGGFEFKSYGSSCREGEIQGDDKIAPLMQQAYFGVHLKHGGDGYGHVLHNWGACGRPLIFRETQYKNKLGGRLLKHLETGLDLDKMTYSDIMGYIKSLTPGAHRQMCEAMHNTFLTNVDFDKEANDIKLFLERLQ